MKRDLLPLWLWGGLIALGKLLNSDEPITLRLVAGRVIVGAGLSVIAGVALYFVPNIHPLALLGFGSGLGILGQNVVEAWLRKRGFAGILGKGVTK